jgi:hypothetical protein
MTAWYAHDTLVNIQSRDDIINIYIFNFLILILILIFDFNFNFNLTLNLMVKHWKVDLVEIQSLG